MKTEISRDSHRPEKRYSGVYQQQGRMITDADWNEMVDILKGRLDDALKDVVGSGSPLHRHAVDNSTDPPNLQWGAVYVDGIQAAIRPDDGATLHPVFEYAHQLDFPSPPATTGDYLFYVDVWERTVTHLMDERLRDKGLHGADTCTRKQTVAQVKWCPDGVDPEQSPINPSKGDAQLSLTLLQKSTQPDTCDPCAADVDVDSTIGDYLFRVEVHDVKGNADDPTEITLKWSGENAAEHYALKDAGGADVAPPAGFKAGPWAYEFFDETSERHLGVHLVPGFSPVRGELTAGYPVSVPARRFVRRWDGFCRLVKTGGNWSVAEAFDRSQSGPGLVTFTAITSDLLSIDLDALKLELRLDRSYVAGDFWLADVRQAEHAVGGPLITAQPPQGIDHHYLTLGRVVDGVLQANAEADRKHAFPPLTEMTRMTMAGGDGQEAMPSNRLPHPLQVTVGNGEWPVSGAKVRFELENPDGLASGELGSLDPPSPAIVVTADSGMAECTWTLGASGRQRVKASLLDPADPSDSTALAHPPIYFNANLSVASNVFYDASEKAGRWRDINQEEEGPVLPTTVQEAIDDLAGNLHSEDIRYTPGCTAESPPTVRSKLDVAVDRSSRVHEVFDKLLCDFNATHLPVEKNATLCSRLNVTEVETVQDALDTLCRMERGSGCAVTVGEDGGQHPTIRAAIDALTAEHEISLCLMPGRHRVDANLAVSGKRSIKITGAGPQGSVIEAHGNLRLAADDIRLHDLGVDVASFAHGIRLEGDAIGADGCAFTRTDVPDTIHLWSKHYRSSGREYSQAVAMDPAGNTLITGYFSGAVDFSGQPKTAAAEDLFVAKLDPKGDLIWVQHYPGHGNERGLDITVDPAGNVLVTGQFDGDITVGNQTLTATGTDLFVLKLEPDAGNLLWARNFQSKKHEHGMGIAADAEHIILTGYFEGTVDFDQVQLVADGTDLFVVKLESKTGEVVWANNYAQIGVDYGMAVAMDAATNIYVTGYFNKAVRFGDLRVVPSDEDLFVLKLGPKGKETWVQQFSGAGSQRGMGIAVDPKGEVVVSGYFDGKVDLGGVVLDADDIDLFVAKLEPQAGKVVWAKSYSHAGADYGMAVAADAEGNILVAGSFKSKMEFGRLLLKTAGDDIFIVKLDSAGKEVWVKQFGGTGSQQGLSIAVSPKGQAAVSGYFSGRADFDGQELTARGIDLFALVLEPTKGKLVWVRNFTNVSDEFVTAVAVDTDGNVLTTGRFNGAVDFGGTVLDAVANDLFVLKLGPDGKTIWAKQYQGTGSQTGSGIAVDAKGNVLVTGWFDGRVDFDGHTLDAVGKEDLFILMLSPLGDVIWARNFKGPDRDQGSAIAADDKGNALVTGSFAGTLDFDGHQLTSAGPLDLFVVKLNSTGQVEWARNYPGDKIKRGSGIAADADGNVLVTGSFEGSVVFGSDTFKATASDLFVLKLSDKGEVVWARAFGGGGDDIGHAVAVDKAGNAIVSGQFNDVVDFDHFRLTSDGIDLFVLKLDPEKGAVLWARNYQGSGIDVGRAVAVAPSGHVHVTGVFNGEVNFDDRVLAADGNDLFVLKLDPDGRVVWAHNYASSVYAYGLGVVVDRQGHLLVGGLFDGTLNVGSGALTSTGTDLFIIKLAVPDAAPPLVEIRPATDRGDADLDWNRNRMLMPASGDAVAMPGLRLDGLFDALVLSAVTVGGNIDNNRILGSIVLASDFPDSIGIDPQGTVVGQLIRRNIPFMAQSVLTIQSNLLNSIRSRIPLGTLQNRNLSVNELELFGSMVISGNAFRENGSSFLGGRMTISDNQFIGASHHSDVAAFVYCGNGTFSGNQAHPNAMIQRMSGQKKQAANELNFQDLIGSLGKERLVLLNGEETPAGTIVTIATDQPPDGWFSCDGRPLSRHQYAALFDAIDTRFGAGNGTTTFNIPDLSNANALLMSCIKY